MSSTASVVVAISNRLGLHARPAMLFAETACKRHASVTVKRVDQDECVDGKSIMQLMMLAATQGTQLEITACGEDAQEALKDLVALIETGFQEE